MAKRRAPTGAPKPFLAITLGDPAGIGPWVGAATALDPDLRKSCRPVLIGDAWVLHRSIRRKDVTVRPLVQLDDHDPSPHVLNILHVPHPSIRSLKRGVPQRVGGESAVLALRTAVTLARAGRVAAVVTGPASKESFALAGVKHPGHTEFLAHLCNIDHVEMVMAAGPLRTVLITRHIPLNAVSRTLTRPLIVDAVRRVDAWARAQRFTGGAPRWALCGLNPHAGDHGILGREEIAVVGPAAAELRRRGVRVGPPEPADVAWARHAQGDVDFVASLYHDQGMIPLKTLAGDRLVNITVGLPFVRTSPGHGTAFDVARGPRVEHHANPLPTLEAARVALSLKA